MCFTEQPAFLFHKLSDCLEGFHYTKNNAILLGVCITCRGGLPAIGYDKVFLAQRNSHFHNIERYKFFSIPMNFIGPRNDSNFYNLVF